MSSTVFASFGEVEDVFDPHVPVVDAHHHLIAEESPYGVYGPEDLCADVRASGHNVEQVVFVEFGTSYLAAGSAARRTLGETKYAASCAEVLSGLDGPRMGGVVARVDLREPGLEDLLKEHAVAAQGLLRGIRHAVTFDPTGTFRLGHAGPAALLADPSYRRGAAVVGRMGLVLDTFLFADQLSELTDFAIATPDTTLVVNHLGCPVAVGAYSGRRDEVIARWRSDLALIADQPNIRLKIGGIGMPIFGLAWRQGRRQTTSDELVLAWGEEIGYAIDLLGPERCMMESNFPIDKLSFSYRVVWNAFKKIVAGLSPADRDYVLRGTAIATYKLGASTI
jgi:L-fuconolactonase